MAVVAERPVAPALYATAVADPAPQRCAKHFFGGEMPGIAQNRAASTRLLCFSAYATLHSGLSKTPVWSAEHLTADSVDAAASISKNRPNNFHAETRLPIDERAELAGLDVLDLDVRGFVAQDGMPEARDFQDCHVSLCIESAMKNATRVSAALP